MPDYKPKELISRIEKNFQDVEFDKIIEKPKTKVIRFLVNGDRSDFLTKVSKYLNSGLKTSPISEFIRRSSYSSSGHIKVGNIIILAKPSIGATENLGITTSTLVEYGQTKMMNIFDLEDVKCQVFDCEDVLVDSIWSAVYKNPSVSLPVLSSVSSYLDTLDSPHKISWHKNIRHTDKNELGKYFGEIILGATAFTKNRLSLLCDNQDFSKIFAKKLIFPAASNFKSIDSFILTSQNKILPISSKKGLGSAASFFSGILPSLRSVKIPAKLVLARIIDADEYSKGFIPHEIQYGFIWYYGLKYILGMNGDSAIEVFKKVHNKEKVKNMDIIVKKITNLITTQYPSYNKVLEFLNEKKGYSSITGFFCRMIAKDLNSCPKSLEIMRTCLLSKNFYQANLDATKWLLGQVKYNVTNIANLKLRIDGRKSSYTDIRCHAGKLNYELYT